LFIEIYQKSEIDFFANAKSSMTWSQSRLYFITVKV